SPESPSLRKTEGRRARPDFVTVSTVPSADSGLDFWQVLLGLGSGRKARRAAKSIRALLYLGSAARFDYATLRATDRLRPPTAEPSRNTMAQDTRKDPRAKVLTMTVRYKSATIDEF